MNSSVLAAQLYTVRQYTQTERDLATSMQKIREIGYQAVQVSGIGPIPLNIVKKIMDDNGLHICITHIGHAQLWNQTQAVIDQHLLWNCKHVAIGSMPQEYRATEEGYRRFALEASQVGEKLSKAGLTFSYHNHSFEFARFGKRTGLDILYSESDPRFLKAEIDTYWVQHGGADPVVWVQKMKDRMPVVHLKDKMVVIEDGSVKQIMAEIGEGNLNWPGILKACRDSGVEWYAVEQDTCQRDPFESLRMSYEFLKSVDIN